MSRLAFEITPSAPYDFALTAGNMTFFQQRNAAEVFADGVLQRALVLNGKPALVSVRSVGSTEEPHLCLIAIGDTLTADDAAEAQRQMRWMLATDDDITPFYEMAHNDTHLAPLVNAMYGLRHTRSPTPYEALILAILGQQISTHVAHMLRSLIIDTYGTPITVDGKTHHTFPQPQALADAGIDGLRSIKFSQRKAEYIADISAAEASGALDLNSLKRTSADRAVSTLTKLRGVGPWTAQWMLIRALAHPDGFPHGDLALQRMMGSLVGDGTHMPADKALEYSQRWSPHRSYVTTYMFAAGRSERFDDIIKSKQ